MEADLRGTPLYGEVEGFFRAALEPGFGRAWPSGDPHPSPDGRWIAFVGHRLDGLEGSPLTRICLVDARGGDAVEITGGPNDDDEPRWSPDGSRLSFRSDRDQKGRHQLYILETGLPSEARPIPTLPGTVEWHRWSADGARMLVGVAGAAAEQADALGSGTVGSPTDLPGWIPEVESSDAGDAGRSLWQADLDEGSVRRVSPEHRTVWEADWCGGSSAVAVVSDGSSEGAWYGACLSVFDLDSGAERVLARSDVQFGWATGSPDGSRVAVIEALCSDRVVVCGDLRLIDVGTGAVSTIELGGADASRATWIDDDRLAVFGRRGLVSLVLEVSASAGTHRTLWSTTGSIGEFHDPSGSPFRGGVAVITSSHRLPPSIVTVDASGMEREVSAPRHAGHDIVLDAVGSRQAMRWTSTGGLEIEGLLTLPRGDGPFPTVVHVHGGPIGAVDDRFPGTLFALLLSRGFAILQPNPRGSAGRGQAFASRVIGDMGGLDVDDVLTGVDAAVAAGHVDRTRLVLTGGSYGGFMAALIPTRDDRFMASVSISPVTDWWSERFDSTLGPWVEDFLGGPPLEVADEYAARSPVLHVDRVTTPVLLTAGRKDRATPVGQAIEYHRALRERGVPTDVVLYPQEGHGVSGFPAVIDLATRMVGWFERFLPPAESGR